MVIFITASVNISCILSIQLIERLKHWIKFKHPSLIYRFTVDIYIK
ncbi:hypothetical protein VCRA2119O147_240042 [Vibrio crassostreae]|nr:hypothetical protein VCRA2113O409_130058 [Vibrio crassostreae]CAK1764069.1 hypothetical protein VCRA2118O236_150049 [Vibrio crassostreae]CAK1765395.1 hypothetical protein VCRA2114O421_140043 [Vibrio crassostreae]CAK1766367.1 hypothetical protein VCRA2113O412_140060 [Vibrio crassostreae]CAK1766640.1 hypothetical protein VCRA2119O245_150043 [Vibrio crassostreae]